MLGAFAVILLLTGAVIRWRRGRALEAGEDRVKKNHDPLRALSKMGRIGGISRPQLIAAAELIHVALREHLTRTYGLTAQRMTTQELKDVLQERQLETGLRVAIEETLEACDLIRFAGWNPPQGHLEDRLSTVLLAVKEGRG
ncbi:MAG: hypothetical protein VKO21_06640 [Candidatus Sericytochromatia bacterium]|nr:hypothetical protein [Candidatus Sericytochromatia bacterium]